MKRLERLVEARTPDVVGQWLDVGSRIESDGVDVLKVVGNVLESVDLEGEAVGEDHHLRLVARRGRVVAAAGSEQREGESHAKFWLEAAALASSHGFRSAELSELRELVVSNRPLFQERWDEFFSR